MQGLRRGKRVYTAPQQVDDNYDVKPEDFAQPETRGHHQSFTAYLQSHPYIAPPPPPKNIPLKCDQEGSHVEGASLFNAPVFGDVEKLKAPEDRGMAALKRRFSEYDVTNRTAVPTNYVETVRAYREPPTMARGGVPEPAPEYNRLDSLEVMMRSRF